MADLTHVSSDKHFILHNFNGIYPPPLIEVCNVKNFSECDVIRCKVFKDLNLLFESPLNSKHLNIFNTNVNNFVLRDVAKKRLVARCITFQNDSVYTVVPLRHTL